MKKEIGMTIPIYDFRNPDYLIYPEKGKPNGTRTPMTRLTQCPHCGGFNTILLDEADFNLWTNPINQKMIHEVFVWLSPDQREILKTGTHSKCWEAIFPQSD